jgi:hypothetical protein
MKRTSVSGCVQTVHGMEIVGSSPTTVGCHFIVSWVVDGRPSILVLGILICNPRCWGRGMGRHVLKLVDNDLDC